VLVCGVAVLVEFEPESELVDDDEVEESSDELLFVVALVPDDDVSSSDVDAAVAAVECLAVVVPASLHAMAPPRDSAAVTLRAAAIRRARWARGFLRSGVIGGSSERRFDLDRPYGSRVRLR
jgi:hypothetical protein